MRAKLIVIGLVTAIIVTAGTVGFVPLAFLPSALVFQAAGFFRLVFPSTISWGDQDGYLKCPGAIADPAKWPSAANTACRAMELCANEAPLSDNQRTALYEQIHKTPGCQEP
jgi:hypothetical protein